MIMTITTIIVVAWEIVIIRLTIAIVTQTQMALITSISSIHIRITIAVRIATTTRRILRGVQLHQAITVPC